METGAAAPVFLWSMLSSMRFNKPEYAGGSIANLMRTIADACGAPSPTQEPLHPRYGIDAAQLATCRNIVLLVVDGLGADLLESHGTGTLRQQAGLRLTSVFPSTTASAIPLFMTGLVPAQHALTGWHMWLDELQAVAAILPLTPRIGPPFATPREHLPEKLFDHAPLYPGLNRPASVISPQEIAFSPFNVYHTRGADVRGYASLGEMLAMLAAQVTSPGRKFIHAYWPTLDSVSHRYGACSDEAIATLQRFCAGFDVMLRDIAGSDTRIFVTADHGFIDSPEDRIIELADHPALAAMLDRPLCGEQRVAWCYVKPEAHADFARCAKARLGERVEVISRRQLLDEHWLGPGPAHAKLASRIGDFALVMRENWSIKDWLPGERRHFTLGVHGGISPQEMQVPLVAVAA